MIFKRLGVNLGVDFGDDPVLVGCRIQHCAAGGTEILSAAYKPLNFYSTGAKIKWIKFSEAE